jgi:hypothetical protein
VRWRSRGQPQGRRHPRGASTPPLLPMGDSSGRALAMLMLLGVVVVVVLLLLLGVLMLLLLGLLGLLSSLGGARGPRVVMVVLLLTPRGRSRARRVRMP